MPVEDVEQAVFESKWGTAEEDASEVIARMLEVPRALVVRVNVAYMLAANLRLGSVNPGDEDVLDESLLNAYSMTLRRGLTRVLVRKAIVNDTPLKAPVAKLVTAPEQVCRGCPFSVSCIAEQFTTPTKCFKEGPVVRIDNNVGTITGMRRFYRLDKGMTLVKPTRIRGDQVTVACDHPRGEYVLDVGDLSP